MFGLTLPLPFSSPFYLLYISTTSPLPLATDLGENENRNSDKDNPGILAAPFGEKLVSSRREPAIIYTSWTRTEISNLPKNFPNFIWDPDGFAKEFNLKGVRLCKPGPGWFGSVD